MVEMSVIWEGQSNLTISPIGTAVKVARGLLRSCHRARTVCESHLHELIDARSGGRTLVEQFSVEVADD